MGIADVMQCGRARDGHVGMANQNRMVWQPLGHDVSEAGMMIIVSTAMRVYQGN